MKQTSFFKTDWKHHYTHGGVLRNKRKGRGRRALSTKDPLHVVFKINKVKLRTKSLRDYTPYFVIHQLLKRYSRHFYIKVEQTSVQHDHIHLLIRTTRRTQFQNFFRVMAGQIAQRLEKEGFINKMVTDTPKSSSTPPRAEAHGLRTKTGVTKKDSRQSETPSQSRQLSLWKHRPFTRIVKSWKAYKTVRNYIQLNETEALNEMTYQKKRLKGLSTADWHLLWS